MSKTTIRVVARLVSVALFWALSTVAAHSDPLIIGNTAGNPTLLPPNGGRIMAFDYANGSTVDFFVPDGAAGNNGRGVVVLGNEVYYTQLTCSPPTSSSCNFPPTDNARAIRVAPFDGGAGGSDFRFLPHPRPGTGIQALAAGKGALYVLTGDGPGTGVSPARVYRLDTVTGKILNPPNGLALSAAIAPRADGFTVLPNGNFLVNTDRLSCTYLEMFGSGPSAGTPTGTQIVVPDTGASSQCTGVDVDDAGQFLYFFVEDTTAPATFIVRTNLSGGAALPVQIADNSNLKDISVVHRCPACDLNSPTEVLIDTIVSVNFNVNPPTCSGNPQTAGSLALCNASTFSFVKPTSAVQTWKAIFDLGDRKLRVAPGGVITTVGVPASGNNRKAPGIEIRSSCCLTVDLGGAIFIQPINQPSGELRIRVDGPIEINGQLFNGVQGTNGPPGPIIVETCCGGIKTGPNSRIETVGDKTASNITLAACCIDGNIELHGIVDSSYKTGNAGTINIAAMNGSVSIDGTNDYGIIQEGGTSRRSTSGVFVRSRRDPIPGFINIQAGSRVEAVGA